jgi:uncharacterized protein (TIGR02231 family)
MRYFIAFLLTAMPVCADEFIVSAPAQAVILHPQGTVVEREFQLDLPQGQHTIVLDVDADSGQSVFVLPDHVRLHSLARKDQFLEPAPTPADLAVAAHKDIMHAVQARLDALIADRRAAQGKLDYLATVEMGEAGISGVDLAEMLATLGQARRSAEQERLDLDHKIEALTEELNTLREKLDFLQDQADLAAPAKGAIRQIALEVYADQPVKSAARMVSVHPYMGGWSPVYQAHLDAQTDQIRLLAQAFVHSDLPLADVALTLSTGDITQALDPSTPRPNLARAVGKEVPYPLAVKRSSLDDMPVLEMADMPAPGGGTPAMPVVNLSGPVETYVLPGRVDLSSEGRVLDLSSDLFEAELALHAMPRRDDTAFRVARFTNTSDARILGGEAQFYVDETWIGDGRLPAIAKGDQADLGFGPFEPVRLSFDVLENETGDQGLLTKSNTRAQSYAFTLRNLSDQPQTVRSLFALPYSEQEDLKVSLKTSLRPNEMDVERKRGVGAWVITLPPGGVETVRIDAEFSWPEGQVLDWRP